MTVTVTWNSATIPYSPAVSIDWGDGSAIEDPLTFMVTGSGYSTDYQHDFLTDGLMEARVIVYNDASAVEHPIQVRLFSRAYNNNNDFISIALFHVKHAQLR